MRTTIVPAQITTVEDKIAGNLTLPQIFLLLLPIFLGGFMYISFPPILSFAIYKIVFFLLIGIISGTLAIRIKEKMVVSWLIILFRYIARPKFYIFNKNDLFQREIVYEEVQLAVKKVNAQKKIAKKAQISITEAIQLERFISNPKANISFRFEKKGGINVSFSEIK